MKEKLIGNLSEGLVFVLSAPAGAGKTTLVHMLTKEFSSVKESVSYTTRQPRIGEVHGVDYYFVSQEEFAKKRASGDFLECAEVFGQWYGTSKEAMQKVVESGSHVFLVIDTQGAMQLQKEKFKAIYIFIAPPSIEVLEERLIKRQTEDDSKRAERLSWAAKEIESSSSYDFLLVNDDLQVAYSVLKSIVIAEERRVVKKNR